MTLKNLTAKDIQEFYLSELERVSPSSVIHYHANIHKALKYAVKIDLIDVNPADKVERPKKDRYVGSFYDADEVNALFEAAKGSKLELPILFGAFYGLRRSEAIGLKWDAIDFDQNTITIRHTVTSCDLDGKRVRVASDTTKTKSSMRTLPLVPFMRERLLALKEEQQENRRLCGRSYIKDYANFRTSYKRIDGISYTIYPGEWIMSVEELSRYFRTRFRRQTLTALEGLQKKGLISFLILGHGKLVKFKIRGWRRHNTILDYNAPCQKDTGFFFFPVSTATELVSAGHCSEMDAVLDLWLNTVYNDPQVLGSDVGPVVYLRNGTGCPLVSYAELASRWGISKATAGRYLKRMVERGYLQLAAFPGTHGTTIYLQNYLSTMFQISDIVVDKEEIAMSLGIKLELQEETALTTAAPSGSNEPGSVSEMNRHRIERKMREILVAQGLPCASCAKSKYMLLPLSDDCEVTIEGVPPLRRWLQLVVTCGDAQEVYHFELRLHPTGMRGDKEAER